MTVKLSPLFNEQTFDANGDPASGYKLFTYAAGSSTKQTTYSDSAGLVPQSNPIILNASGYPTAGPIWLTAGQTYKFVLASATDTDPPTSPLKTFDNISGINDSSNTFTQWISSGVTPTYVSASSFTLSGDQTSEFHVGRRLQLTVTAGTVYGTIATAAYGALTTITLTMDGAQVLDAGLSTVNLSVLRADNTALPKRAYAVTSLSMAGALTGATDITSTGNTILGDAATDTLNVGNGGLIKDGSGNVGVGVTPTGKLDVLVTAAYRLMLRDQSLGYLQIDAVNAANSGYVPVALNGSSIALMASGVAQATVDSTWKIKSLVTAKAWANWDGTLAGPITPRSGFNVGSITKNATGDYTLNFSNALTDANYAPTLTTTGNDASTDQTRVMQVLGTSAGGATLKTTSALRVVRGSTSAAAPLTDGKECNCIIMGN